MNLFKGKNGKEKVEHIAVILMRQDEGIGYICKLNHTQKTIDIIDERAFPYSNAWENLVYDIDELLFTFENTHAIEIKKASFFVYSHLIDSATGDLKLTYLGILKDILHENKLESLGYIELEESLAKSYTNIEQAPLNAVLIEVDNPAISAFVYQGGSKVFAHSVAKTENLIADLEEIFKHLDKGTLLPARVLMYDSSELESESHTILTHSWPDNLFVQLPRVDVVREHELKQAIILGVTEEVFGISTATQVSPAVVKEPLSDQAAEDKDEPAPEKPSAEAGSTETPMGFVIGRDIKDSGSQVTPTTVSQEEPSQATTVADTYTETEEISSSSIEDGSKDNIFSKIKSSVMSIKSRFIQQRELSGSAGNKKLVMTGLMVGAVVLLFGAGVAVLYYFHSATLTVLYKPELIEDTVTFDKELKFTEFTEEFTVSASVKTTGTQDIGEKASGEATIFNADDNAKTFEKGTELSTSGNLVYVLDSDVTVEGATKTITDDGDVLASTSKATASITAAEIGAKHNIKDDTKMSVDGFSDTTYFARASGAISGGTTKEVQTASKKDFTRLDGLVEEELAKKSKEKLKEISEKGNIVDELTTIDKTDESYSKELSEEADTIEADVTADVTFFSFDDSKIKETLLKKFKDDVPSKYVLDEDNVTYTIVSAQRDEDTEEITIDIEAVGSPVLKIDSDALVDAVKGSSLDAIRSDLEKSFNADGYEAEVQTPLPFLQSRLPWFSQNITVESKPLSK